MHFNLKLCGFELNGMLDRLRGSPSYPGQSHLHAVNGTSAEVQLKYRPGIPLMLPLFSQSIISKHLDDVEMALFCFVFPIFNFPRVPYMYPERWSCSWSRLCCDNKK